MRNKRISHIGLRIFVLAALVAVLGVSFIQAPQASAQDNTACAVTPDVYEGLGSFTVGSLGSSFTVGSLGSFTVGGLGSSFTVGSLGSFTVGSLGSSFTVGSLGSFTVGGLSLEEIVMENGELVGYDGNIVDLTAWFNTANREFETFQGSDFNPSRVAILIVDNDTTVELADAITHADLVRYIIESAEDVVGVDFHVEVLDVLETECDEIADLAQRYQTRVNELLNTYDVVIGNWSIAIFPETGTITTPNGQTITVNFNDFTQTREEALQGELRVGPVLECVAYGYGEGEYIAVFGYDNDNLHTVNIPRGPKNKFTSNGIDPIAPETFEPGRQQRVFSVPFTGSNLVWTLTGPDGVTRTSTAGAGAVSEGCNVPFEGEESITPTLTCVVNEGDGAYAARFGYNNPNSTTSYIRVGESNGFSEPLGMDQGQPEYFLPGDRTAVFEVPFTSEEGSVTWYLDGSSKTASVEDIACGPETEDYSFGDYLKSLSGNGGATATEIVSQISELQQQVENSDLAPLESVLAGFLNRCTDGDPNNGCSWSNAASGNNRGFVQDQSSGMEPFPALPYFPARNPLWNSVGGTLGTFGGLAEFSHDAKMVGPGAFFINNNGGVNFPGLDNLGIDGVAITGTSFATPLVVFESALWEANGPGTCVYYQANGQAFPPTVGDPNVFNNQVMHILGGSIINPDGQFGYPLNCGLEAPTPTFDLTINVNGGGSVDADPSGLTYDDGTTVTLTANANPGFIFDGWSGVDSQDGSTATVTMNSNRTVTATFTEVVVAGPAITGFELVNSRDDFTIGSLNDGDEIDLSEVGTKLNINALTSGTEDIKRVVLELSGDQNYTRTERVVPYLLFGNNGDNFYNWRNGPNPGSYTLKATPFDHSGNAGTSATISFTIVADDGGGEEPTPTTGAITSFTLYDSRNDQVINEFDPIDNGEIIDLGIVGDRINIRANTNDGEIESVRFNLSGPQSRNWTENYVEYLLFGNNGSNIFDWTPKPGTYTLTATPYTKNKARGDAGQSLTITFTIVDNVVETFSNGVTIARDGNLIDNGDFETTAGWSLDAIDNATVRCNQVDLATREDKIVAADGTCALRVAGSDAGTVKFARDLATTNLSDVVTLSASIGGRNIANRAVVRVKITYVDGSKDVVKLIAPKGTYDYATFSETLSLRGPVAKARLQVRYQRDGGTLWVDNIYLSTTGTVQQDARGPGIELPAAPDDFRSGE